MTAIHIHQLRFSGREAQRRILFDDLDRVAWPALAEKEYLFIRRLQARQPSAQLAHKLAVQAEASRQLAVSGWASAAKDAEAVYFASYAELLACLSRDLLQGQRRWYWREWAGWFDRPSTESLFDCWFQQQALLPAIAAELAMRSELASFWQSLPEVFLQRILYTLHPTTDFSPVLPDNPAPALDFAVPVHWLSHWQPVFAGRNDITPASLQLAAMLILRQWLPLRLLQSDALFTLQAVVAQLSPVVKSAGKQEQTGTPKTSTDSGNGLTTTARSALPESSRTTGETVLVDNQAQGLQTSPFVDGEMPLPQKVDSPLNEHVDPPEIVGITDSGSLAPVSAKHVTGFGDQPNADAVQPEQFDPDTALPANIIECPMRCLSAQAGIFYLLNFLNLPAVLDSLLTQAGSASFPSAWGWLYRLADALGWQPEPAVLQLFAFLCGLDDVEALQQLPALPQLDELLHLGRQRYGEDVFASSLFAIDGMIEVDVSHIDIYFNPQAVRLDVRRSGLDIDPGWLPWLGKVVKFHYQSWTEV